MSTTGEGVGGDVGYPGVGGLVGEIGSMQLMLSTVYDGAGQLEQNELPRVLAIVPAGHCLH